MWPYVPQVVPAEILDAGALECIPPGARVCLPHWSALEREYAQRMFAELLAKHSHGLVIQRHADRLAALRFVGVNPCRAALHVDVGPFDSEYVGLP